MIIIVSCVTRNTQRPRKMGRPWKGRRPASKVSSVMFICALAFLLCGGLSHQTWVLFMKSFPLDHANIQMDFAENCVRQWRKGKVPTKINPPDSASTSHLLQEWSSYIAAQEFCNCITWVGAWLIHHDNPRTQSCAWNSTRFSQLACTLLDLKPHIPVQAQECLL